MFSAAIKSGAAAAAAATDPQFNYVTMLLHGDGTNGGQNNTFLDSSTNAFSITRNGNTTQGSFSPYGSNWSNNFGSSAGQYIRAGSSANLTLGSGNFTCECWVNPSAFSTTYAALWDFRNGPSFQAAAPLIWVGTDGKVNYQNAAIASSSALSIGVWTHVAIVRNGTTVTMYFNGTSVGSVTDSTTMTNTYCGIGAVNDAPSTYYFNGYISNSRVVIGSAVYTSSFTPPTVPLTAITNTKLLICQSNRFIDNSSNNFTLTVNGSPSVQRFSPFAPSAAYSTATTGGSVFADGTGDYLSAASNVAITPGNGVFTWECWFYPNSFNATTGDGDTFWYGNASGGMQIGRNITPNGNNWGLCSASVAWRLTTTTLPTNGMWNHLAIVRSGTGTNQTAIFMNGARVAQGTVTDTFATAATNFLSLNGSADNCIDGYVTDTRFVKGTAVYDPASATYTVPTAPLTAITNTQLLLSGINGAIYDNAMMNDLETVGNAQISTSVVKYGTGSISINSASSGSYLTAYNADAIRFGTGDLTIECWIYPTQYTDDSLICKFITGGNVFFLMINSGQLTIVTNGYSPGLGYSRFGALSLNTWTYIAVTRVSGTWYGYINGTKSGSSFSFATSMVPTKVIVGEDATNRYIGYIDDFRITKGYARYTASFTAPTAAFSNN